MLAALELFDELQQLVNGLAPRLFEGIRFPGSICGRINAGVDAIKPTLAQVISADPETAQFREMVAFYKSLPASERSEIRPICDRFLTTHGLSPFTWLGD